MFCCITMLIRNNSVLERYWISTGSHCSGRVEWGKISSLNRMALSPLPQTSSSLQTKSSLCFSACACNLTNIGLRPHKSEVSLWELKQFAMLSLFSHINKTCMFLLWSSVIGKDTFLMHFIKVSPHVYSCYNRRNHIFSHLLAVVLSLSLILAALIFND